MLEHARRQFILVLLTLLASIACVALLKPNLGQDLKGGTQIVYDVPEEAIVRAMPSVDKQIAIDQTMDNTVSVIGERCDPSGTIGALVTRQGPTGILIELPTMSDADLTAVMERMESLGKLEMRMVARDDYTKDGVKFDLKVEKERLKAWIDKGGKELLKAKFLNIEQFNDDSQNGPKAIGQLRWVAHLIEPSLKNPAMWGYSFGNPNSGVEPATFKFYEDAEFQAGPARFQGSKDKPFLVEFVAINWVETHFTGDDLDPAGVHATSGQDGGPAVGYSLKPEKKSAYGDWSGENIKKHSAIILNNVVKSAPVFESRIPGDGIIHGDFTPAEVDELIKVLRSGSLRVQPELLSKKTIGATLGQEAIDRGVYSLLAGTVAVFLFMLFFYRMSGLVACITLLLNVLVMYAAVLFMQATVTLPGLGGIVLTMGMAVDANVLIYERIREEVKRGKDLLRATRAGFERAMVVILDANITTFLAGLVLYNIGAGPVRGFAVTLMVGIVTTVFTQFYVTRLLFHWLLETKKFTAFKAKEVLQNLNVDFVRYIKIWVVISVAVIVFGIAYSTIVPRETLLGLDFTGGANLQMNLKEPMSADEVRKTLVGNEVFSKDFLNPSVNTVQAGKDGKSAAFNLRIKLSDAMRLRIEEERRVARADREEKRRLGQPLPEPYQPPYVGAVRKVFEAQLVSPSFSNASVEKGPDGQGYAQITLHFQREVVVADALKLLQDAKLPAVKANDPEQPGLAQTRNLFVQFNVLNTVRPYELFDRVRLALQPPADADGKIRALKDTTGAPVALSNPFPEAEEIQGRIVGDLRNAAIGAIILSWLLIALYLRVRFHEYSFGVAAVVALVHDVTVTYAVVVVCNHLGILRAELDLNLIACFLTIIGYSVNDTIVVFDRIRENAREYAKMGQHVSFRDLVNRSINQTMSRTILTSGVTMFCVLAQFLVNWGSGSDLESFSFAMVIGIVSGTYSSIYIAAPILLWLSKGKIVGAEPPAAVPATTGAPAPPRAPDPDTRRALDGKHAVPRFPARLGAFDLRSTPLLRTDVLVIGAGVAGGAAALHAAAAGAQVLVLAKDDLAETNTAYAQGGIAVVQLPEDGIELHVRDTLQVGGGLAAAAVVREVVSGARQALAWLESIGTRFDRVDGKLALSREGGHSIARVVHSNGDATGAEIQRAIAAAMHQEPNITVRSGAFVRDLVLHEGRCVGAVVLVDGLALLVEAGAVVVATGGSGQIFRETTNPTGASGDGHALCFRAGARMSGCEFVQFHPTTLYIAGASRFLISEVVRGHGAVLRDRTGSRFMPGVHPMAELAPRDVVSRAILDRMVETGDTHVYLDLGQVHGDPHRLFPSISRICAGFDIDIAKDPIPVRPGAHYFLGGAHCDLHGRTSVPGLFVAGEASATGLHGANRLASNSLLEGAVLGRTAGLAAAEDARSPRPGLPRQGDGPPAAANAPRLLHEDLLYSLKSLMWRQVGLRRDGVGLADARARIGYWNHYLLRAQLTDRSTCELANMLTTAALVTEAALLRQESRGTHFRSDHPQRDDGGWCRDIFLQRGPDGAITQRRGEVFAPTDQKGT